MNWKFCMLCGGDLTSKNKHAWQCQKCGQHIYRNAAATADAAILNEKNELLIAIRSVDPGKGKWDLPGGFVDIGETLEQALERELKEELGLSLKDIQSIEYLRSGSAEYKWGRDVTYPIASTFLIRIHSKINLVARDDISDIQWIPLKDIDHSKLFFKPHEKAIDMLKQKAL